MYWKSNYLEDKQSENTNILTGKIKCEKEKKNFHRSDSMKISIKVKANCPNQQIVWVKNNYWLRKPSEEQSKLNIEGCETPTSTTTPVII